MARDVIKKEPIAFRREMPVAGNEQPLVPIGMRILEIKKGRKQVDEGLAVHDAELAPDLALPAVTIVRFDLERPGIDDDRERDAAFGQQVREQLHVLSCAGYAALDPERIITVADVN